MTFGLHSFSLNVYTLKFVHTAHKSIIQINIMTVDDRNVVTWYYQLAFNELVMVSFILTTEISHLQGQTNIFHN